MMHMRARAPLPMSCGENSSQSPGGGVMKRGLQEKEPVKTHRGEGGFPTKPRVPFHTTTPAGLDPRWTSKIP